MTPDEFGGFALRFMDDLKEHDIQVLDACITATVADAAGDFSTVQRFTTTRPDIHEGLLRRALRLAATED